MLHNDESKITELASNVLSPLSSTGRVSHVAGSSVNIGSTQSVVYCSSIRHII